jgi:hypothetical protein
MARTLNWDIGSFSGTTWTFATRNPAACASWPPIAGVYDQFRVNAMAVTIGFPVYAEVPPTGVAVPHMCLFCYDNDTTGGSVTFPGVIESSTTVAMEAHGLQRVHYKLPEMMVSPIPPATNAFSTGWLDVSNNAALLGGVYNVIDSLSTSGTAVLNARVVVEFIVEFRYRV